MIWAEPTEHMLILWIAWYSSHLITLNRKKVVLKLSNQLEKANWWFRYFKLSYFNKSIDSNEFGFCIDSQTLVMNWLRKNNVPDSINRIIGGSVHSLVSREVHQNLSASYGQQFRNDSFGGYLVNHYFACYRAAGSDDYWLDPSVPNHLWT